MDIQTLATAMAIVKNLPNTAVTRAEAEVVKAKAEVTKATTQADRAETAARAAEEAAQACDVSVTLDGSQVHLWIGGGE